MRFRELRHGGPRPFTLGLHPRLTLVTGLGDEGRRWLADLLRGALRGDLGALGGTVEVHGVERPLTEALIAELGLPADVDVLVRPVDLPGARSIVPGYVDGDQLEDEPDGDLPDLRALANELSQARHALAGATENRAQTEALLDGSRRALAPEAAAVADAEARLDEGHRVAVDRARLQEQRATLEQRRQQIMEAIDLADRLDAVHADLTALPEPPAPPPSMLVDAERELDGARTELSTAEAALAERRVAPEDVRRIDELHAEVLDAEARAERRLTSPLTRKRVKDAIGAEIEFLGRLGFSSYTDYLLSTSTLIVDPAAPKRVRDARRRLADAEAVWDELIGHALRAQREELEEQQVALLKHARDLLGVLPEGTSTDVSGVLRDLRVGNDPPDERYLAAALFHAGDEVGAALGGARADLRRAQDDEQRAHRAVVDARSTTAEHRAAIQRIEALEADLTGARAAEQQAAAHVARLEGIVADAETRHEQRRRRRQARAEALDAVLDLTEVERAPTEVYLLARVVAQREVGQAGSLPLVVADATSGLSVETTQGVLDVIERCSPVVQFVLMSDDPDIEEWARSFGADGAAVRRFSFVAAGAR